MSAADTNLALAAGTLAVLHAAGVKTLVLCPGGRNAPLVLAAEASQAGFGVIRHFEERSAGFFALGRIRRDGAPVAVLTTSGTAAAELLPAMLEARHSALPLIAVTADRPRRLRGTGAPQTINQLPLFAAADVPVTDVDSPDELRGLPPGPFHLNICFDEPLTDGVAVAPDLTAPRTAPHGEHFWMSAEEARAACGDFFQRVRRPLVLVSSLDPADAAVLLPWLSALRCPMHLEAVSQLRAHPVLQEQGLRSGERILLSQECRDACDGVLRIGGVPTPRFWRECEDWPVLHVSRADFRGLERMSPVVPLPMFAGAAAPFAPGNDAPALFARDRAVARELDALLAAEPRSEAALVAALAARTPDGARVFLGNSLPIREWNLAAPHTDRGHHCFANRGVNGIDGLVSTALGLSGRDRATMAVIGDLSALYDLAGLWPAAQLPGHDITLAVINNDGGRIFERMFTHPAFLHSHGIGLHGWAEMFGWSHGTMSDPDDPWPQGPLRLVEVRPDADATRRFAEGYAAVWR